MEKQHFKSTLNTRERKRVKWAILGISCLLVSGSFYCYNNTCDASRSRKMQYNDENDPFNKLSLDRLEKPKFNIASGHNIDIDPLLRAPTLHPNSSAILKTGRNGALSSDLESCNQMVLDEIINKYGMENVNSADIAVTLGLCIGMINFFNSGVGGGGYAMYTDGRDKTKNEWFDFRETCPMGWNNDIHNLTTVGGLSIGVPGELLGLYELHSSKGLQKVTWAQLLEPVINLGHNGWTVGPVLGAALEKYENYFEDNFEDWSFVFNTDLGDGDSNEGERKLKKTGDWIKRPALANMLQELATNGSVAPFYDPEHWIVKSMVKKIQQSNGIVTEQDFANYKVMSGKPLSTIIKTDSLYPLEVQAVAGSSSGAALIAGLNMMNEFPYVEGGDYQEDSVFKLVETMKWMASSRSRLGDYYLETGTADVFPERINEVLSSRWKNKAISKMENHYLETFNDYHEYEPAYEMNDPHGTAHFSILDSHNGAVALTTTVNLLFGSLVHDPVTGIVFNNEMDDFSDPHGDSNAFDLKPSVYNFPEPGKRPLSSTVPTVVIDELGRADLVVGASGGSRILTSVFQTIVRNYWYGMPLLESIAYPRVHHQLLPNELEVESKAMIGSRVIQQLHEMGHKTVTETNPKSVVNAIKRDSRNILHAVSDYWRKRGISVTY